jgi:hypothetical protein
MLRPRKPGRPVRWLQIGSLFQRSMPQQRRRAPPGDVGDGTQLTLGENATLVVDEFIYDPSMSRGSLSIRVVRGAFLYVGGRIEGVNGATVQIHTPVGAIGLRGTTVWRGPIDKGYGVIVLSGEVTVTGRRGTVTLKQGQGTMLFADGKPQRAAAWPQVA